MINIGFGKDGKGVIIRSNDADTLLGTLAAQTALKIATPGLDDIEEDFRLIKAEFMLQAKGLTESEYVLIGFADNELTVAEIKDAIEAQGPKDRNDHSARKDAEDPVWILCAIGGAAGTGKQLPNNGMPIEKTFRWTFSNPEGATLFAYNPDDAALTTGAAVRQVTKAFGVWVT